MGSPTSEIVIEQLDGVFSLLEFGSFEEVCAVWAALELDTEGEPGPEDIVLEARFGEWVAFHWRDCDTPVITGYHSLEEIIPAAWRWLVAHDLPETGRVWIKEGGVFSLFELT